MRLLLISFLFCILMPALYALQKRWLLSGAVALLAIAMLWLLGWSYEYEDPMMDLRLHYYTAIGTALLAAWGAFAFRRRIVLWIVASVIIAYPALRYGLTYINDLRVSEKLEDVTVIESYEGTSNRGEPAYYLVTADWLHQRENITHSIGPTMFTLLKPGHKIRLHIIRGALGLEQVQSIETMPLPFSTPAK